MTSEPSVVQSLDRALSILDALSFAETDLELREVVAYTKLPKSTVHRLLATLELRGYVTRDTVTGKYRAGVRLFRYLGSGRQIHDVLARLAEGSGETANLGALIGSAVTYVCRADSPQALRWQLGIGSRVPAHCSALGKAILAHMGSDAVGELLPRHLERLTDNTTVNRESLMLELDRTRLRGYALDDEEFMTGVRCVAVPVHDRPGQVAAAISLSGPAFRLTRDAALAQIQALHAAAQEISALLGHPNWSPSVAAARKAGA